MSFWCKLGFHKWVYNVTSHWNYGTMKTRQRTCLCCGVVQQMEFANEGSFQSIGCVVTENDNA